MEKHNEPCGLCKFASAILSFIAFAVLVGVITLVLTKLPYWFDIHPRGLYLILYAATASAVALVPSCFFAQFTYDYFVDLDSLNKICMKIRLKPIVISVLSLAVQFAAFWLLFYLLKLGGVPLADYIHNHQFISYALVFIYGILTYSLAYDLIEKYFAKFNLRKWCDFVRFYLNLPSMKILNKEGNAFGVPGQ